jgi:molecular chaperone DnaK
VERARKALRGDDQGEIRAAQEELTRAYSEAGQSLYQQQGAGGAGGPQPGGDGAGDKGPAAGSGPRPGGKADDVVEADYEIVDEKK